MNTLRHLTLTLAALSVVAPSAATPPDWCETPRYAHYADRQPLAETLAQLADACGVALTVSERVDAPASFRFADGAPQTLLRRLAADYRLSWYYDGSALYVYRSDETRSAVLTPRRLTPAQLQRALRRLGVLDARFPWRADERRGLVYLSGPPRMIELVDELAARLDATEAAVYRWTGADGVTHFSSTPPPAEVAAAVTALTLEPGR